MINFKGKVAIVTGSGSGIGEASARLFASLGAKVVVADIALAAAESVAKAINAEGGTAIALPFDLRDDASIKKMIDDSVARYGRLDILHANAADLSPGLMANDQQIANMDGATWNGVFQANCTGTMLCTKYAIPHMIAGGGGSIIVTSSPTALRGNLSYSAYSASKIALIQLVRLIATQYGKQGVRANAVLPGYTLTAAVSKNAPEWFVDLHLGETLTPRLCTPIDTANAVVFLASDAASMITAQALPVDGGEGAHWPGIRRLRELTEGG